jgi:hypothetical protein
MYSRLVLYLCINPLNMLHIWIIKLESSKNHTNIFEALYPLFLRRMKKNYASIYYGRFFVFSSLPYWNEAYYAAVLFRRTFLYFDICWIEELHLYRRQWYYCKSSIVSIRTALVHVLLSIVSILQPWKLTESYTFPLFIFYTLVEYVTWKILNSLQFEGANSYLKSG